MDFVDFRGSGICESLMMFVLGTVTVLGIQCALRALPRFLASCREGELSPSCSLQKRLVAQGLGLPVPGVSLFLFSFEAFQ